MLLALTLLLSHRYKVISGSINVSEASSSSLLGNLIFLFIRTVGRLVTIFMSQNIVDTLHDSSLVRCTNRFLYKKIIFHSFLRLVIIFKEKQKAEKAFNFFLFHSFLHRQLTVQLFFTLPTTALGFTSGVNLSKNII